MRVLIVSDVTCHMRGGVPVQTGQLIQGLVARGHAVALAGDGLVSGGEAARHYPISVPTGAQLAHQLRAALDDFKPDVVHVIAMGSRGTSRIAPMLRPYPWAFGCHSAPPHERIVPFLHGVESLHYAARSLRYAANTAAWRWLLSRRVMPHVIVHSKFVQGVVTRYGCPIEHTTLIPLSWAPPETPRYAPLRTSFPDGPRLVTVGGIAHTKGQHDVITALAELRHGFPTIRYQLIGEIRDASYIDFLKARIRQLGLAEHVLITPNLSNDQKQVALMGADLYVQPSHEEGFCLAYIEAAAVVPRLVGTDTGAIGLISAADPAATVVPVRQPKALAEAIRVRLDGATQESWMSQRAVRLTEGFSMKNFLDAHEAVYRQLLASRPSPSRP